MLAETSRAILRANGAEKRRPGCAERRLALSDSVIVAFCVLRDANRAKACAIIRPRWRCPLVKSRLSAAELFDRRGPRSWKCPGSGVGLEDSRRAGFCRQRCDRHPIAGNLPSPPYSRAARAFRDVPLETSDRHPGVVDHLDQPHLGAAGQASHSTTPIRISSDRWRYSVKCCQRFIHWLESIILLC